MPDTPHETTSDDSSDDDVVVGVLLAAGRSTRFESGPKLVATIDGRPLVAHAGSTLVDSSVDDVIVVTGYAHEPVREAVREVLDGIDAVIQYNPDYASGQQTTVACGAAVAIEMDADAVVFALGDMPAVDASTVDVLVDAWRAADVADDPGIFVPASDGQRGNPVCFDRRHLDELAALDDETDETTTDEANETTTDEANETTTADDGDAGGRQLFDRHPVQRIAVDDPGIHMDLDTPAALEAARAELE